MADVVAAFSLDWVARVVIHSSPAGAPNPVIGDGERIGGAVPDDRDPHLLEISSSEGYRPTP